MKSETNESQNTPEQEARTRLRESFLKAINTLKGEPCSLLTYEQSKLSGTFSGWKTDGTEILCHNLKTPANVVMKSALLRTPDILVVQFDNPIQLSL